MPYISEDLHTHTLFSHGKGTPEQNVQAAVSRGLSRIAVSEHGPAHLFYGVRGKKLDAFQADMRRLKAAYADRIDVCLGMECNLLARGLCDLPDGFRDCDVRILGFHKGVWPRDMGVARALLESLHIGHGDPVYLADALLCAAEKYRIHIISHPSLYAKADLDTLAKGCAQLGVLLEINNSHPVWDAKALSRAAALGAHFIIGSDAHKPENVGNAGRALSLVEAAGLTGTQVENYVE
ncbi:MAG: PHP domain-containing protein [Eubacteriales bacterium]|nr:PHP domain-containing protein [Eubacteriales bacterium]